MSRYEESAGRGMEIIIGLLVSFVALIFCLLLTMLVTNASFNSSSLVGAIVLVFFIYWFGQITYRLLFNKPRQNGGLFGVGGLKFWCVFMSLSCVCTAIFAAQLELWGLLFSCITMLVACAYGWQVAKKREQKNITRLS